MRTKLDQINKIIKTQKHIEQIDYDLELFKAKTQGWKQGFEEAENIYRKIRCERCYKERYPFEMDIETNMYGTFYTCKAKCRVKTSLN